MLGEVGRRVTGSCDLYGDDGRSAFNSVNFITCHDGFTLHDLVSYDRKRNDGNLEHNNDGSNDNHSWNCGAEGETEDPGVPALRLRLAKNHACHLIFSWGTPMVLGGDEFLRTQKGNNNAYCQDNGISWHDWSLPAKNSGFLRFFRMAVAFTRRRPVLLRRKFLTAVDEDRDGAPDIAWFGTDLGPPRWDDPECRTLAYSSTRAPRAEPTRASSSSSTPPPPHNASPSPPFPGACVGAGSWTPPCPLPRISWRRASRWSSPPPTTTSPTDGARWSSLGASALTGT
ncbi:MAG: hypothetical protein AAB578_03325, partial [Elusimicrobiota bacterium]